MNYLNLFPFHPSHPLRVVLTWCKGHIKNAIRNHVHDEKKYGSVSRCSSCADSSVFRSDDALKSVWTFVYNTFDYIEQSPTIEDLESRIASCTAILTTAVFELPANLHPSKARQSVCVKEKLEVQISERGQKEGTSDRVIVWGVSIPAVKVTRCRFPFCADCFVEQTFFTVETELSATSFSNILFNPARSVRDTLVFSWSLFV
jgi:hypothetical protein